MNNAMMTAALKAEMMVLEGAIALQKADIDRCREEAHAAAEAFEAAFGYHPGETPGMCPGWDQADAEGDRLADEDGFFWAMSRHLDLRHAFGRDGEQLRLVAPATVDGCDFSVVGIGDMPRTHKSVLPWLAWRVFGAQVTQEAPGFYRAA
jgi:hypothetical protein